jgi:tripartite-type tricarboxylate transporter receptor subunit TctC
MRRSVWRVIAALAFGVLAFTGADVRAQDWPARPIRIVVPFPAGSATDLIARLVGKDMSETLNQAVVIENKPGAGGAIGADQVAHSAPDGYALLLASNTQYAANVSLYKKLSYDPAKDFAPVARLSTQPTALLVRPDFPARTLAEFVSYAKARPGKLSGGYGSASAQVAVARLEKLAGLDVLEVPYKGIPLAVADVIGGTIDFTFGDMGSALAQTEGGKMRALVVTSAARSPLRPDWPAAAETYKGFEVVGWHALAAPAGTPPAIVQKLQDAALKAVAKPQVIESLAKLGVDPAPLPAAQLGSFITSEIARWADMIKEAGIPAE